MSANAKYTHNSGEVRTRISVARLHFAASFAIQIVRSTIGLDGLYKSSSTVLVINDVVPFAGTWIETFSLCGGVGDPVSRALRGHVD